MQLRRSDGVRAGWWKVAQAESVGNRLAIVVQVGGTAIEVTDRRERNNVRIKAFAECVLIGAIKSVFTLESCWCNSMQSGF